MNGQTGFLKLSSTGKILQAGGDLAGSAGEAIAPTVMLLLRDVAGFFDTPKCSEKLKWLSGELAM